MKFVKCGLPQGSDLGQLLFIIDINEKPIKFMYDDKELRMSFSTVSLEKCKQKPRKRLRHIKDTIIFTLENKMNILAK